MGVKQRGAQGSGKTYFSIFSNQLVIQYDNREDLEKKCDALGFDPDDIQVREKSKGKNKGDEVFFIVVDMIDGIITDIRIKENDYGDFLEVELDDVGDKFVISLGNIFESKFAKDFIRRMDNLDLGTAMDFGVWSMTADETGSSARAGVKMYQNDEKIEYSITYDDMPEPEKKKKGREITWDYSEQAQFLFETIEEFIGNNFKKEVEEKEQEEVKTPSKNKGRRKKPAAKADTRKNTKGGVKPKKEAVAAGATTEEENEDDLPF